MSRITKVNIAGQIYNLQDERLDATNIKWSSSFDMNNFKEQGIYYITGERLLSEYDNLPIANASSGHTISGQLTVLDASLSQDEQCITQYLKLTNRTGSEGKEYIRTYNKYSNGKEEWSAWREIKQTANLNQISDAELKNYTENGAYEGVIVNGALDMESIDAAIELFLLDLNERGRTYEALPTGTFFKMDVLNNYAVAEYAGLQKNIVQKVKALLINGIYLELYRVNGGIWTKI